MSESAYTSEVGEVGATYLRELATLPSGARLLRDPNQALPATFRWHELFDRLVAAAGLRNASARIGELLRYNNQQVEKRRAATALLDEAAKLFRFYEKSHRAKAHGFASTAAEYEGIAQSGSSPVSEKWRAQEADTLAKAERNAEIAARIETFLKEIHQ